MMLLVSEYVVSCHVAHLLPKTTKEDSLEIEMEVVDKPKTIDKYV
jgi:hypothetical protein